MSQPVQHPPKPPLVRLSTWVNVVLVLILFVSCAGADTADDVVNRLQNDTAAVGGTGGLASSTEVEDLCRLLGAVAAKQGVPLSVMNADEMSRCHEVAQEAATAGTP